MAISEAARFPEIGFGSVSEETGGGIALIVLGILALAKIQPMLLNSIAVIVAGATLAVAGAAMSGKYARALAQAAPAGLNVNQFAPGMAAGVLGGASGVVLGILALIGVGSETLIAVALIVFGASVLFDYGAQAQLRALRTVGAGGTTDAARVAMSAAATTNAAALLLGVGLITLGILSLTHLVPVILSSAAFVAFGTYLLLEGGIAAGFLTQLIPAQ